jgi:hypothetical protein
MFNLREPRDNFGTTTITTATSSVPTSTILSLTLTNIEQVDEDVVDESLNYQEGSFYYTFPCGHGQNNRFDNKHRDRFGHREGHISA